MQGENVIDIDGPIHPTNKSAKILSILSCGHEVSMWYCDDEFTREEVNPGEPVRIHLRAATPEEYDEIGRMVIQYRTRGDEVISETGTGQPGIEKLIRNRSWTVDKQN